MVKSTDFLWIHGGLPPLHNKVNLVPRVGTEVRGLGGNHKTKSTVLSRLLTQTVETKKEIGMSE